jgi:hypothetical protein
MRRPKPTRGLSRQKKNKWVLSLPNLWSTVFFCLICSPLPLRSKSSSSTFDFTDVCSSQVSFAWKCVVCIYVRWWYTCVVYVITSVSFSTFSFSWNFHSSHELNFRSSYLNNVSISGFSPIWDYQCDQYLTFKFVTKSPSGVRVCCVYVCVHACVLCVHACVLCVWGGGYTDSVIIKLVNMAVKSSDAGWKFYRTIKCLLQYTAAPSVLSVKRVSF